MTQLKLLEAEKDWKKFEELMSDSTQPFERKIRTICFETGVKTLGDWHNNFIPESKENFLSRRSSIATFAVVKDGEWFEKGEMGWFATVSNKKQQGEWNAEYISLVESLSEDTLISLYDCHI